MLEKIYEILYLVDNKEYDLAFDQFIKTKTDIETKGIYSRELKAFFYSSFSHYLFILHEYSLSLEMMKLAQDNGYDINLVKDFIYKRFIEPNNDYFELILQLNIDRLYEYGVDFTNYRYTDLRYIMIPTENESIYYLFDSEFFKIIKKITLKNESFKLSSDFNEDEIVAIVDYDINIFDKTSDFFKKAYLLVLDVEIALAILSVRRLEWNKLFRISYFNSLDEMEKYFSENNIKIPRMIFSENKEIISTLLRKIYFNIISNNVGVSRIIEDDRIELDYCFEVYREYLSFFKSFISSYNTILKEDINQICCLNDKFLNYVNSKGGDILFKKIILLKLENDFKNIDILSKPYVFFLKYIITENMNYLEELLKFVYQNKNFIKESKLFLYFQIQREFFIASKNIDYGMCSNSMRLYKEVLLEYEKAIKPLKKFKKNKNERVVIAIAQLLGKNHAPTKLALDIAYYLSVKKNKQVLIINTKECLSTLGAIYLPRITMPNVLEEYSDIGYIDYKEFAVNIFQPSTKMVTEEGINLIRDKMIGFKPEFILNIGTNMVTDLCKDIAPVATLLISKDEHSYSNLEIIPRAWLKYRESINKHNICRYIIQDLFFEIKEQKSIVRRIDLGLPENKFIISIVGNRLQDEVSDDFLKVLDKLCFESEVFIVFITEYNVPEKYGFLRRNCVNLGYVDDLASIMENIDIYLNPIRKGGGTSAIYALSKGKPVITMPNCDVAIHAGKNFEVDDLNEMYLEIKKYKNNASYYEMKSNLAVERSNKITDVENCINEMLIKINKGLSLQGKKHIE